MGDADERNRYCDKRALIEAAPTLSDSLSDESRAFFGALGELLIAGDDEYQHYSLGFRGANSTDKATTAPVRVENHDLESRIQESCVASCRAGLRRLERCCYW